ncbi:MAG: sn-glycerol-1-phosphate dehydrogenase [Firmicutes bacterium]|nr:sn-glycerol-1-phosphate dehydrogenase [Bacillota bacterium]
MDFSSAPIRLLIGRGDTHCACGRPHTTELSFVRIEPGATRAVPEALARAGIARPFIVCDANTRQAAWPTLEPVLREANIPYTLHILPGGRAEPDERAVGSLCMAFDRRCGGILAVGSGVINDCCKVLAHAVGLPSVSFATAPSMDGYASNSSSMIQGGLKVSLYNACPAAIVGDIDIIRNAPLRMLWAGLGDMLAKYVSLCEWRVARLVTGEYYCENIAGLVRASLRKVARNAERLAGRDPEAVRAVMEGLVLSGVAMSFAKMSRPASGLEHYFSHVWEMMAFAAGKAPDLHGIQVGVGTYLTLRLYEQVRLIQPDREKALRFVAAFDEKAWEAQTRGIFGKAAESMIEMERTLYHKNDPKGHAKRLGRILECWPMILRIIEEELPPARDILRLAQTLGMPILPEEIGIAREDVARAFLGSRDIRDKYLTSSLLWDLGLLYEIDLPLS